MRELNSKTAPKTVRPERIIQFGEGNFPARLRGLDYIEYE